MKKPTLKQKKALSLVVGNGGNITKAMLDAGYSPNTANTPSKLTDSKQFQILLAQYLPDDKLLEKHSELLNKKEVIARNNVKSGEIEVIPTGEIDPQAVKSALDMAYKLKGSYSAEKHLVFTPKPLMEL
jgi:phage terminase small subunit